MAVIFFLSAQPDLPHPEAGWADLLFASGSHALEFGVLAVLLAAALEAGGKPQGPDRRGPDRRRTVLIAFVVTALYALSDEFHQSFVPGRVPDPWDLVCDVAGALTGLALWAAWRRRLARSRGESPG